MYLFEIRNYRILCMPWGVALVSRNHLQHKFHHYKHHGQPIESFEVCCDFGSSRNEVALVYSMINLFAKLASRTPPIIYCCCLSLFVLILLPLKVRWETCKSDVTVLSVGDKLDNLNWRIKFVSCNVKSSMVISNYYLHSFAKYLGARHTTEFEDK